MQHTLVKHVAQRAVVQDHDLAQVGLDRTQVLDERPVSERTVLAVEPVGEVLSFRLEPVDHRVGILLHRRREDHQVEPLGYLIPRVSHGHSRQASCLTFCRNLSQCGRL